MGAKGRTIAALGASASPELIEVPSGLITNDAEGEMSHRWAIDERATEAQQSDRV